MKKLLLLKIILMVSVTYGQITLSDSLQLYYPFNGNALDLSDNGNDGVVVNATLTSDRFGIENAAYEFDGYYDYILTNSTFDYIDRSISLWVKPYDINGLVPNNHVAVTQDDYRLKYGIIRVDFNNGDVNLWAGGINNIYTTEASHYLNKWTHIVLTRDTNSVNYFVNAALVHTDIPNSYGSTYDPDSSFIIGAGRSTELQFFEGKIDDIRIYNRVLTQKEIIRLFIYDTQVGIPEITIHNDIYSGNITIHNRFDKKFDIRLIDINGRMVFRKGNISDNSFSFIPRFYSSGLYVVHIIFDNKSLISKKIILLK